MRFNPKKLVRDPFVILIALVVIVPALLVIVAAHNQNQPQSAVNSVSNEVHPNDSQQSSSSTETADDPKPITEAEQPNAYSPATSSTPSTPAEQVTPPVPTCDQAQKQAAQTNYNSQLASENSNHQQKLNQLKLISVVTRKYRDEEIARHQAAVAQIESTYQAALAAANC